MGRYDLVGLWRMAVSFLYTRLFYRSARIIRLPFDIRNRKYINMGKGLTTGHGCRLEAYPGNNAVSMFLGDNIQMNDYVHITAMQSVTIGNNVLMASKIYISDCAHGSYAGDAADSSPLTAPAERPFVCKPVVIEDNVWLGEFVSVLPGTTIGKGTIVGANSVVSKSLPANVIAVGSPARPIKKFNFETNQWERI
jgi:acetyltransferase-like isoleucine patch superfamily enzyme